MIRRQAWVGEAPRHVSIYSILQAAHTCIASLYALLMHCPGKVVVVNQVVPAVGTQHHWHRVVQ